MEYEPNGLIERPAMQWAQVKPSVFPVRDAEVRPLEDGPLLPPDPRRSLHDMFQKVWRWRTRFLVVFGAVACLGLIALFVMPLKYSAQALIMVGARETNALVAERPTAGAVRELDVDGTIQVIISPLSMRRINEKLDLLHRPEFKNVQNAKPNILIRLRTAILGEDDSGLDPVDMVDQELQRHLKADRLGRSAFVMITYTARNPKLAADIANAAANNTAADDAFLAGLTVTERAGFDLLRTWVVSPAAVPTTPSSPNFAIVILVTLVGGLCVAFSAVLFADYFATRRVTSADQIARHGVRALGFIPMFDDAEHRTAVRIVSEQPHDAFSDSIAGLRASLLRLTPQNSSSCLVLMFASAVPFEGKSTTVSALAASITASGGRVLLIDADLRASTTLHRAFGASAACGLSNCLDETPLDALIQVDPHSGVHLLTAGPPHPRPLDILCSRELATAIERWRESFDFILIDVPPVLATPDALALVPVVDYCVFIVRWGKTDWETMDHGLRLLTEAGARIAGVAVSRVDAKQFSASGFPSAIYGGYGRYGQPPGLGEV
jgi:capsular exopolysaccharide synthesis family protein